MNGLHESSDFNCKLLLKLIKRDLAFLYITKGKIKSYNE